MPAFILSTRNATNNRARLKFRHGKKAQGTGLNFVSSVMKHNLYMRQQFAVRPLCEKDSGVLFCAYTG